MLSHPLAAPAYLTCRGRPALAGHACHRSCPACHERQWTTWRAPCLSCCRIFSCSCGLLYSLSGFLRGLCGVLSAPYPPMMIWAMLDMTGVNELPFIEWMEDQWLSIRIIVSINSYTIVIQHIVTFPCLILSWEPICQRECPIEIVKCQVSDVCEWCVHDVSWLLCNHTRRSTYLRLKLFPVAWWNTRTCYQFSHLHLHKWSKE